VSASTAVVPQQPSEAAGAAPQHEDKVVPDVEEAAGVLPQQPLIAEGLNASVKSPEKPPAAGVVFITCLPLLFR
jgi:hypothetical protein